MNEIPVYYKGPFKGAYKKGVQARKDDLDISDCPYSEIDTQPIGGVTYSVAFSRAWKAGWADQDQVEQSDE